MATTIGPTPAGVRVPPPPARLNLTVIRVLPGLPGVDGVWWPRSRDLSRELRALTDALDDGWGRVTRATVDPTGWPVVPREVRVTGRTVRVGWFLDERHPYELILLSHAAGRCELLVVPPETKGAPAAWPAPVATVVGSLLTAGGLMAREEGTRTVAEARAVEEARTGSGGRPVGLSSRREHYREHRGGYPGRRRPAPAGEQRAAAEGGHDRSTCRLTPETSPS
ncbi:DUF5994 family protein [Streptomyces barkulensis]|uniref:DUF5994 family protein n=1 Tax=Streptomyces barkulensis TaxID=1257026 RepID=UPI000C6D780E|nr:DUF5994 family protein [Streptomyces barkulensis]